MKFVTRRPLITVWLQVRVLPGPLLLECTLQFQLYSAFEEN
jgi:hypothetical protein